MLLHVFVCFSLVGLNKAAPNFLSQAAIKEYAREAGLHSVPEHDVSHLTIGEQPLNGPLHVQFPAFGEVYNAQVKSSGPIVSAQFVEFCGDEGLRPSPDKLSLDVDNTCLYRGYLEGIDNSFVALTMCKPTSVTGWLIGNYTLLIHPVREDHARSLRSTSNSNNSHPHLAFRVDELYQPELYKYDVHDTMMSGRPSQRSVRQSPSDNSVQPPVYVELMVAFDKQATSDLGTNLIPYVVSMTNMLATGYRHPTVEEFDITIRLTRIILIDDDTCLPTLDVADHSSTRLGNFKGWANEINPSDEDNPFHFDYALFLTNKEFSDGVGGRAYQPGMCWGVGECHTSTSLWCIGHEVGHSFGMTHDSERCPDGKETGWVSGSMYKFTPCNMGEVRNYLRNPPSCLLDKPNDSTSWPSPEWNYGDRPLPAKAFPGDEQCKAYYYGESVGECSWKSMLVQNLKPGDNCYVYCEMRDGSCQYWATGKEGHICGPKQMCSEDVCKCIDENDCPQETGYGLPPTVYTYVPFLMAENRDTAIDICTSNSGRLAKILNKDTLDFLKMQLASLGLINVNFQFDGRRYSDNGNDWETVDGEHMTYFDWYSGEPNNGGNEEKCLHIWKRNKQLNDINCETPQPFICQKDGKGECFMDKLATDYRGRMSTTANGFTCQKWSEQSPHTHANTPEKKPYGGLGDHNYCRNPDNWEKGPWCYTNDPGKRYDVCDLGTPKAKCAGKSECYEDPIGTDYRGALSTTAKGYTCMKWATQSPHEHTRTPANYPSSGLGDHNYCRNPDNSEGAWCYTTDPSERWGLCDIGHPGECARIGSSLKGKMVASTEKVAIVSMKEIMFNVSAVTVSYWIRTKSDDWRSTAFIYSTDHIEDAFSIRNADNIVLSINGVKAPKSNVAVNTGCWHHVCATWEGASGDWKIYKDGTLSGSGSGFQTGSTIVAGGIYVIARGQDTAGDVWDTGLDGDMAHFNIWSHVKDDDEIKELTADCNGSMDGDVLSWNTDAFSVQSRMLNHHPIVNSETCLNIEIIKTWRDDEQCGAPNLLPNGQAAECDPMGNGRCCSASSQCGSGDTSCNCQGCIDYSCKIDENTERGGDGLVNGIFNIVASREECCVQCRSINSCKTWSFDKTSQQCWLRDAITQPEDNDQFDSGIVSTILTGPTLNCIEYTLHLEIANWDDATAVCQSEGGRLAIVKTAAISDVISAFLIDNKVRMSVWIGLKRDNKGVLHWIDGTAIDDNSYTNWAPGEPYSSSCVNLWQSRDFKWDDTYCSYALIFLCEFDVSSPSCSNTELRMTAVADKDEFKPEIIETVLKNFYIHDCLISCDTETKAISVIQDLISIRRKEGFNLTKWITNSHTFLKSISVDSHARHVK
ncbi:uncharacterized protein LOC144360991 [Saccoglossus kowalevskii]